MKRSLIFFLLVSSSVGCYCGSGDPSRHDFHFTSLAKNWDEGMPLGNGMLGLLIWQRDSVLRMSLDRADLWDLRSPAEFKRPEFKFSWVIDQVNKGDYKPVQDLFDLPYDRDPYPTKIPAGAIEFSLPDIGKFESVDLSLERATCEIRWLNGMRLTTFVHASRERGWFRFDGIKDNLRPKISAPPYNLPADAKDPGLSGPSGNDLRRLGYPAGSFKEEKNMINYSQACSEGMNYDLRLVWNYCDDTTMIGCWTIVTNRPYSGKSPDSALMPAEITKERFESEYRSHMAWWEKFWSRSSIQIPDSILETQWYREMYKLGSASRKNSPPITLQAVWTADNSRLPPWKGDFHNDLNTQLSYLPCYSSNHLDEGAVFTDWLWDCKESAEAYTKEYFGVEGLNFPGVSTLKGEPMGGWIQYALGPTVSAWLSQHFYFQWRYSMDREFLEERAYPWLSASAAYLENICIPDSLGRLCLPISSSPEINDNDISAWFHENTKLDLSLMRWLFGKSAELASELGLKSESSKWLSVAAKFPPLALDEKSNKLLVAPGHELKYSHRHFSHLMSIYPLGIIDVKRSTLDSSIIHASLYNLDSLGTDYWCGYSYAWLGSLWARARNGERAAEALKTFSTCFCLPNSFHVNGDQSGTGKSKFTYRPFTLEGNFAFAAGLQEMLLQSFDGLIRIFPAIPGDWNNVEFENFRAEGAFVISAVRKDGVLHNLKIESEKGGVLKLLNPFDDRKYDVSGNMMPKQKMDEGVIEFDTTPGMQIELNIK